MTKDKMKALRQKVADAKEWGRATVVISTSTLDAMLKEIEAQSVGKKTPAKAKDEA